jgi:hypothetical protein
MEDPLPKVCSGAYFMTGSGFEQDGNDGPYTRVHGLVHGSADAGLFKGYQPVGK